MKSYFNINKLTLLAGILFIGAMVFGSCDVDHSLNANKWGKVYLYQATQNPVKTSVPIGTGEPDTVFYGAAYGGPKRSSGAISVSFSVNPALVDSFNTKHRTSYPILPEKIYTLSQKKAVIPADSNNTPAFRLTIKGNVKIPTKEYLLPLTVHVNGGPIQVSEDLQTAYFLITAHEFIALPTGHNYTAVFSDDPRFPKNIFFIGKPANKPNQWVWKYNISSDAIVKGFPKKLSEVFPLQIPKLEAAGWIHGNPHSYLNFYGNGQFYHVIDQKQKGSTIFYTKQVTGALQPIENISDKPWPSYFPTNPKRVDCSMWISNRIRNFVFVDDAFGVMRVNPHNQWRANGGSGVGGTDGPWPGVSKSFTQQGLTGCYYNRTTEKVHFFSGDEFVIYKIGSPASQGQTVSGPKKIEDEYNGL